MSGERKRYNVKDIFFEDKYGDYPVVAVKFPLASGNGKTVLYTITLLIYMNIKANWYAVTKHFQIYVPHMRLNT